MTTPIIELHIFTNSTVNAPSLSTIFYTYTSFKDKFGDIPVTVWCDPHPNVDNADLYVDRLKTIFPKVNISDSLSDGYVKAINQSQSKYLFMLEHDWEFLSTITHSLNEILNEMQEKNLWYMLFHQHKNTEIVGREGLRERAKLIELPYNTVPHCSTTHVSNNPHIIDREQYIKKALKFVEIQPGSDGIEWQLIKSRQLNGTIYGGLNYPKTINHINGKLKKSISVNEPIVISFYTNDWEYPLHAKRLAKDCENLGIDFYIEERKSTKDYIQNTAIKPFFIRDCFLRFKRPMLWVDVDGLLLKPPNLDGLQSDFAACDYFNKENLNRDWAVSILWFNYSPGAKNLLDEWCANSHNKTDEAAFDIAWKKIKSNLTVHRLPQQYHFVKWKNNLEIPPDTIFCNQLSKFESKLEKKKNSGKNTTT